MNSLSPAYYAALKASKEIHKGKQFTGKFLRPHASFIKEIIDRLQIKSILDFGCGKGQQYEWVIPSIDKTIEQYWGVSVTKYDPAYPPFSKEPEGKFDLVICTQVLGAIPVNDLGHVIEQVYCRANKAVYISERLGEARKVIGDNSKRPYAWTAKHWMTALSGEPEIEVTFAIRETIFDQKITQHFRCIDGKDWLPVVWSDSIKAMNHKWMPE